MDHYTQLQTNLARGWNTWNTQSVLSHVLLPESFAINLGLQEDQNGAVLKEALIGRSGAHDEQIHPGPHAYDGSYTQLRLQWQGIDVSVQTATEAEDLVILVTPNSIHPPFGVLVVEASLLWNAPGCAFREQDTLIGQLPNRNISVHTTQPVMSEPIVALQTPYLAIQLREKIGISTHRKRNMAEIAALIDRAKIKLAQNWNLYGELAEVYGGMQTSLAWDTIYEPAGRRVITTVSRIWNLNWGGYVLFCWDTYFAAYMAALDHKELAYANAIEITREMTEAGFVPNFAAAGGLKSRDRSQPPVGSLVVRELYRRYRERWLLEDLFEPLFTWNSWFAENREVQEGLLAWGSNPYAPRLNHFWEKEGVGARYGAALESGLDNSPMYDGVPYHETQHLLELADVGLIGLYIMDCHALADIAGVLGKAQEASVLRERSQRFARGLNSLWDEPAGLFRNRRADTGEFSNRLSPTLFYALFSLNVTQAQAEKMVEQHLYNPEEFWGEWVLPSIARNDPAFPDQDYWRGRIWAPLNFLVYLGLRRFSANPLLAQAQRDLTQKSMALFLREWLAYGHVHENYSGITGMGCDKPNSDKFYHWGALLGFMALMEKGYMEGPEKPLP